MTNVFNTFYIKKTILIYDEVIKLKKTTFRFLVLSDILGSPLQVEFLILSFLDYFAITTKFASKKTDFTKSCARFEQGPKQ